MRNYKQPGEKMKWENTTNAAVASGDVVPLANSCGIAEVDIADDASGTVALTGVYELGKDADESFDQGDDLYYDASDDTVTKTAAGNTPIGKAHEDAGTSATSALVRLCDHDQRAANVAYSAGSNLSGVDGTGSNAAPLTGTETRLDAIDTAIAAILTALKDAGVMKNS